MVIPIVIGALGIRIDGLESRRTNRDHPKFSIVEIGQNTENSPGELRRLAVIQTQMKNPRDYPNDSTAKNGQDPETSPGDLRRVAVTQTPVKDHQLTLM